MITYNFNSNIAFTSRKTPKREIVKQTLAPFVENSSSDVAVNMIKDKYHGEKFQTYEEVAKVYGTSVATTFRKINGQRNVFIPPTGFIDEFVREFGVDSDKVLIATKKNPSIVPFGIGGIRANAQKTVELLKSSGLTMGGIINSYLKQPALILSLPNTIASNFNSIVSRYPTMDSRILMRNFLSNPSMFYQSPETISEHLDIVKFMLKNKFGNKIPESELIDKAAGKTLTYSTEQYYLRLLNRLMFANMGEKKLKETNLRQSLTDFLKNHSDLMHEFSVVEDKCARPFIEFVENFSFSALGKNIFNIKIRK